MHDDYYHESDLAIGAVLYVWGRRVVICDADDFTKEFYRTKYGIGKSLYTCTYMYIRVYMYNYYT